MEASTFNTTFSQTKSSGHTDVRSSTKSARLKKYVVIIKRDIVTLLKLSKTTIQFFVKKIYCRLISLANKVLPGQLKFNDTNKLYQSHMPIDPHENEFNINQAICCSIKTLTGNEIQHREMDAIKRNYLSKAAKIDHKAMEMLVPVHPDMSVAPMDKFGTYHRWNFFSNPAHWRVPPQIAARKGDIYLSLDESKLDALYPLRFEHIHVSPDTSLEQKITKMLETHYLKHGTDFLDTKLDRSLLFDFTDLLENVMYQQEPGFSSSHFKTSYSRAMTGLRSSINKAARSFSESHPELSETGVTALIKENACFMSRSSFRDGHLSKSGLLLFDPFNSSGTQSSTRKQNVELLKFFVDTGTYIGPGEFQRKCSHLFQGQQQSSSPLAGHSPGEPLVKPGSDLYSRNNRCTFTKSALFLRLKTKMQNYRKLEQSENRSLDEIAYLRELKPFYVLFDPLVKMIDGCFASETMTKDQWNALMMDPVKRNLLQVVLLRLQNHLASMEMSMESESAQQNYHQKSRSGNYSRFTEFAELSHAELKTILTLTRPYSRQRGDGMFGKIYLDFLEKQQVLPENLRQYSHAGLAKTGINAFSAVMAMAKRSITGGQLSAAYSKGFYFEQVPFIGEDRECEHVLSKGNESKVDVYACQIHPGIEIATEHHQYQPHNVTHDIDRILKLNRASETRLTVIMDCTIDYIASKNIRDLFAKYHEDIINGRINFVFFRSGQKYDMYGMDNYYGAPFFMVNNGNTHWQDFNHTENLKAIQPDNPTYDYFCLSYMKSPDGPDEYRKLIFDNTRSLQKQVPPQLLASPDNLKQRIRVSQVNDEMNQSYLDIKVNGRFHYLRSLILMHYFYSLCKKEGIKAYTRASFGFQHTNIIAIKVNEVPDSTTIRLSPGECRKEQEVIIKFLNKLVDYL